MWIFRRYRTFKFYSSNYLYLFVTVIVTTTYRHCCQEVYALMTNGSARHDRDVDIMKFEESEDNILSDAQEKIYFGLPSQRNALAQEKYRWPNAQVVYQISSSFTQSEREIILKSMKIIESKTVVSFRTKMYDDADFVMMHRENGCRSKVGRQGGEQYMNLSEGCIYESIIVHELVHAIGLRHEQCRSDRDDWVDVNWSNIYESNHRFFHKYTVDEVTHFGLPYDYGSIMHYSAWAFAIDSTVPVLTPKKEGFTVNDLGPRAAELTPIDIRKINMMYSDSNVGFVQQFSFVSVFACILALAAAVNMGLP